jgi:hypothetical protein
MTPRATRLPTAPTERASVASRLATTPLELCTSGDRFHDYVLGEYEPLSSPEGKLRSVNLLVESFAFAGVEAQGLAVVDRIRRDYGPYRTIYGIKWNHASRAMSWELYFYDFARSHADCSLAGLREIVAPEVRVDAEEPWTLPWHMFSIEVTREQLESPSSAPPVAAHVYIDMRSYELRGRTFTLENVYTFHDPRAQVDEILHRLKSSTHFDPNRHNLAALMPPPLFRCGRVCVANKRSSDAIYFSRVPSGPLRWFLERHSWPEPLRALVTGAGDRLDHLLWDVGVDFRSCGDDPAIQKTGVYGSF